MIRVLIAEASDVVRGARAALLSLEDDMEVVAELNRGDTIVETALRLRPDVAVFDVDLPGLDGLTAAERLHAGLPGCRTLLLTALSQPGDLLRALKAHVSGFMLKDAPAKTLIAGVRRIAAGKRLIDPELVAVALETGSSPLTVGESDVLRAVDSGLRLEEIASTLSLSRATVDSYLFNAISKAGGRSHIDTIRIAKNAGWI